MRFLKEYFAFSSSERRGIFAFSLFLCMLIASYFILPKLFPAQVLDSSQFKEELVMLDKQLEQVVSSSSYQVNDKQKIEYFKFNPNTVSKDELISLGLTEKLSSTIINFRNKGGRFYKKQDMLKIYGMNKTIYHDLVPWIVLDNNKKDKVSNKVYNDEIVLFNFNPNTVLREEMEKLGFSKKQSNNIINYREKGGVFKQKEDLKKIYTISDDFYAKIEDYIEILVENNIKESATEANVISINIASKEELIKLKGIGDKLSSTIIKYRGILGGFHSVNQLKEVYGLSTETIDNIESFLVFDIQYLNKININTATLKELYSHKYLSYNDARKIVNYRTVHGLFTTVNEIKLNDLVKDKLYSKIAPYLTVK